MRFFKRSRPARVLVIGLDSAGPQLVFEDFKDDLPNLKSLAEQGTWGALESSIPCITVPAWASMLTSRDPGVLGIYGFRNRANHSYDAMTTASSMSVQFPRVWDYAGLAGRDSVVLNVPQTYPVQSVRGHLVSDFLTPGIDKTFTYPAVFKQDVLRLAPNYVFDVHDFRTLDKAALLRRLYAMADAQFSVVKHCITTVPWDFFMHVDMGVDRVHHGFWRYHDSQHRLHSSDSPFRHTIRDYYKMVDERVGQLLELAGDDVIVLVVSDHGVTRMDGGICLNEWLWRNGWLALKSPPQGITRFEDAQVDWSRTRAWGSGGYYGRVFLNVEGREPQGIISPRACEQVRNELAAALAAIPDVKGAPLNTRVFKPQDVYQQVTNVAPDLMVYFGDLHWRSVGSLGHENIYTLENDTGPDDANHDTHGLFILYEPNTPGRGRVAGCHLMDIAPTLLHRLGLDVPPTMQGRIIER